MLTEGLQVVDGRSQGSNKNIQKGQTKNLG